MTLSAAKIAILVCSVVAVDLIFSTYVIIKADHSIDHNLDDYAHNVTKRRFEGDYSTWHYLHDSPKIKFDKTWIVDHHYSFFACQLDFLLIAWVRIIVVTGATIALLSSRGNVVHTKINNTLTPVTTLFFVLLAYSPIKLLALAEVLDDFSRVPWFWVVFFSNVIFTLLSALIWICILAKFKYPVMCSPTTPEDEAKKKSTSVAESEPLVHDGHVTTAKKVSAEPDVEVPKTPTSPKTILSKLTSKSRNQPQRLESESDEETTVHQSSRKAETEPIEVRQSVHLMWRLLNYCKDEWVWYLFGFLFLLAHSAARIFVPWYTSKVISDIVVYRSPSRLMNSVVNMIYLSVFSSVFSGLRSGCFMYAIAKVNVKIRSRLFESLVKQEIGFFDASKTGEITSRLTSDCQVMSDTVATNVNLLLRCLIMLIGSISMMTTLSWRMTMIVFIILPVVAVISKVYGKYYDQLASMGQDALAKCNELAEEVLGSMKTVRSFANEMGESRRYNVRLLETLKIGKKKSVAFMGFTWINEWIDLIVLAAVLWYGGHLVVNNRLEPENLIAYLLYQLQVAETLFNLGSVYTGLMQAVGASRKVFELIDRRPLILNEGCVKKKDLRGQIEFQNVNFSYPTQPDVRVLKNISFSVKPGEICALVGPSGGGKSSCISLLEHFYEPLSGQILLDDVCVNQYDHLFYHRAIALVGQEPVLYAKSIAQNISYGLHDEEYGDEDVIRAAKLANAHQFIIKLGKKYETDVGERGMQISGGQKQRVAIARAIVRKPKVLLLDEATSALDAESEHLVQKALYENLSGYTIILIAHRLSTVRRADRIIVIDKGRVVQQGTHDQLLKEDGGLYKHLVQRQLLGDNS